MTTFLDRAIEQAALLEPYEPRHRAPGVTQQARAYRGRHHANRSTS